MAATTWKSIDFTRNQSRTSISDNQVGFGKLLWCVGGSSKKVERGHEAYNLVGEISQIHNKVAIQSII